MLILGLGLAAWQLAAWRWDLWWRPAALIGVSYLLQWIGHAVEGNDMGELIVIKKLMGRPYVAVAPPRGAEKLSDNGAGGVRAG